MHLYKSHPTLSPGDLTDLRSALVDNVTFGYLSVKNGFHKYLLHASPDLFKPTDECIIRMHQLSHPKETLVRNLA